MKNIFIGSSIIEQWSYPHSDSLNLGISGLTSDELQKKYTTLLQSILIKNQKQNLVIYIGSNDITHHPHTSPLQIYTNITEFISQYQYQYPHTNIIFIAILKSPNRTDSQNKKINYINRKMREFSQKHTNIYFCNVNRKLSSPIYYLSDKTHLTEKGYSILSQHISPFLL